MPIIKLTTWKSENIEKKQSLLKKLTHTLHEETGVPLDKISVYMEEVEPSLWADAGVTGDDTEFQSKSRRKAYDG
ncbi:tautomerase family protein [Microbulbifer sp. 2205BS26-8]|uniref:tautomerase family protein n=1 Tax=Microbulbifer sp. 2205BS26-8 TaxID=3064386 RepID=UPI00273E982F|nr:tautomerase family protein [Microbulbifer sp. 2205BS26-8]MDP5211007.1 tautomerase family protein [Microbulbifer sp. 2205BS26-8]